MEEVHSRLRCNDRFGRRELFGLFAVELVEIGLEVLEPGIENQNAH